MELFEWLSRRCGGVAFLGMMIFSHWVVSEEKLWTDANTGDTMNLRFHDYWPHRTLNRGGAEIRIRIFAMLSLLIHVLVLISHTRIACSILAAFWDLVEMDYYHKLAPRSKFMRNLAKTDKRKPIRDEKMESLVHAIIIPSYKESLGLLQETLRVLASHDLSKNCYEVERRSPRAINYFASAKYCLRSILPWRSESQKRR